MNRWASAEFKFVAGMERLRRELNVNCIIVSSAVISPPLSEIPFIEPAATRNLNFMINLVIKT